MASLIIVVVFIPAYLFGVLVGYLIGRDTSGLERTNG